jgi:hypothetical protein
VIPGRGKPGEAAYRAPNRRILRTASDLAIGDERAVAFVVARPGEGQMIEDLIAGAERREIPVLRVDPE